MQRAAAQLSPNDFELAQHSPQMRTMVYALCTFHALVVGRHRFGRQGWNRSYSFTAGDLTICKDILINYLALSDEIPWTDLRYIFAEIMYGGHITDPRDRRVGRSYLEEGALPTCRSWTRSPSLSSRALILVLALALALLPPPPRAHHTPPGGVLHRQPPARGRRGAWIPLHLCSPGS